MSFSFFIIWLALLFVNNQLVSKNVLSHFNPFSHLSTIHQANHHSSASNGVVHSHSKAFIVTVSLTQSSQPFKYGASLGYFSASFSTLHADLISLASLGYLAAHSAHFASHTHGMKLVKAVTHKSVTTLGIW